MKITITHQHYTSKKLTVVHKFCITGYMNEKIVVDDEHGVWQYRYVPVIVKFLCIAPNGEELVLPFFLGEIEGYKGSWFDYQ